MTDDEMGYEYVYPENQPCEWHIPAHDALSAMQAPPPLTERTITLDVTNEGAGTPAPFPRDSHALPPSDVARLRQLARVCCDAFFDEDRPAWATVRELSALALKLADDWAKLAAASQGEREWKDGNAEVPPLIDDTDTDSEWVEIRAQAYWYSDGGDDFGWLVANDTIKWRPLPAQGQGEG